MPVPPTPSELVRSLLSADDPVLFDFDEEAVLRVMRGLRPLGFRGIAIAAPAKVGLDRGKLPVIVIGSRTALRDWEFPLEEATLAAVHLETGHALVGAAFAPPAGKVFDPPPPGRPPAPEGTHATAVRTRVDPIDARAVLTLPWRRGTWALTLLWGDQSSNTVVVELDGDGGDEPAPSTVGTTRATPSDPSAWARTPDSPALAGRGVAIAMAASPLGPDSHPLHGTLRVAVSAEQLRTIPESREAGMPAPAASIPVTFLMFKSGWQQPRESVVLVPVYTPAKLAPGNEVEAHFTLDPFAGTKPSLGPGTHHIHCLVGPSVARVQRVVP
ncbi:hypothetical protein HPC49_01245 [Pyxidicoccus fallax]|uniref:Uncharacterized protein n=1 Tax=Pyxidicoccus fallax TaxID=394095 RepID=A0A848L3S6_9BACT|nr:hypothetical protein [Pyxidicoccus fallax]NMO13590.1 hypothetical protein [Pyxidicoccus fallax]NPC76879.1 hypothetical protein [Pyxidicoccus fallax]